MESMFSDLRSNSFWSCLGFVPVFLRALFVIKETIYVIKA